jgi:hypothetical protein
MEHWTAPLPETAEAWDPYKLPGATIDLPFNVEEFCREIDFRLDYARLYLQVLVKAVGDHLPECLKTCCDDDACDCCDCAMPQIISFLRGLENEVR